MLSGSLLVFLPVLLAAGDLTPAPLSVDQVVACATVNAARVFPVFRNRGTLKVGAPADGAVLELREGSFEFVDNFENKRTGRQRLFPNTTVLAGKRVDKLAHN